LFLYTESRSFSWYNQSIEIILTLKWIDKNKRIFMNKTASISVFQKIKISAIFTLAIAVGLFFSASFVAHAQNSAGIKIQPSIIEEKVDPGRIITGVLRVTNMTDGAQTYTVIKRNVSSVGEDGKPVFSKQEDETGLELASWITVSESTVTVGPNEQKEVPYTINVPANAPPGGHFGAIFFVVEAGRPSEIGASVGFEVGSIINLQVSGDIVEDVQIREFSAGKLLYGKPDVLFTTRVENRGNILARPRGTLEIKNMFGKKVATLRVNDQAGGVVPNSERSFEVQWEGDGVQFGRYDAVMSLVYGDDVSHTISRVLAFWILPLNIILPVLGISLIVLLIIYISIKVHIRNTIRRIEATHGQNGKTLRRGYSAGSKPGTSRLAVVTIALLAFTVIFLMALFLLFA